MNHGWQQSFDSRVESAQAFLASGGETKKAVLVSSGLPERDTLSKWARAQGLGFRQESSTGSTARLWPDESVALRVLDWAELLRGSDGMFDVVSASSPVLVIAADADYLDLTRIPPDSRMDILRRPHQAEELFWRASRAIAGTEPRDAATAARKQRCLVRGPVAFDKERGEILVYGAPLNLRRAERAVLVHLMQNSDRFVSTRELQGEVLGSHGSGSAARNQVYEVRSKLRALGLPNAILHEPQKGYRLNWDL